MSGEVKRIGDHQFSSMEACRLNKRQGPDPFHHCIGLWCHLQFIEGMELFDIHRISLKSYQMSSYFPKPVAIWDWDVVSSVVTAAPVPVEDGGEVRKVAIQVNVLGVGSTISPTIQQVSLKHSKLISQRHSRGWGDGVKGEFDQWN